MGLWLRQCLRSVGRDILACDILIHTPADVISYASRYFTLKPGDLILTGTPGGVGVFRKPPLFLKDGDVVTCEIDGLGKVTNKVTAIPPPPGMGGGPAPKRAKL